MASLVVIALVTILVGVGAGVFVKLSLAISREDRRRSLWFDAPNRSAQTARSMVGITGSRLD
jgi:hypothetical protein